MTAAIIIPARFGSSRFPGKPMHKIAGIAMLERVWRIAKTVKNASRVVIATEDQRVVDFATSFGAEAVMTPESCTNGTERVCATIDAANLTEDILINLQGDAVLTPPWVLEAMIDEMNRAPDAMLVTPAVRLDDAGLDAFREHKKIAPTSGTTVTFDKNFNALYFSKNIIPYIRKAGAASIHRHIGLYGYRRDALRDYVALPPSPLEITEGLEQLRALENGMKIRIVVVDYRGHTHASVDAPEDVAVAEAIIAREGELFA